MTMPRPIVCSIISAALLAGCTLMEPKPIPPRLRTVRVAVVTDPALRKANPEWRSTASDLLQATSDYLENEFNIRLVPTMIDSWFLEETTSSSVTLMRLLKTSYPHSSAARARVDVVIGLTRQRVNFYDGGRARADRIGDCSNGLGNYIVSYVIEPFIYDGDNLNHDVLALVHEVGHLFGAVHTSDPESVMNGSFAFRTDFDEKNRAVVMKNRLCPFASG